MTVTYSRTAVVESTPTAAKPFVVYEPITVEWHRPHRNPVIFTVPVGFASNLASIPLGARNLVSQFAGVIQAIIHDFCYEGHTDLTKEESDLLFGEGLRLPTSGVKKWRAYLMYWAVRIGGKGHWR